jgi:hypothetical protein
VLRALIATAALAVLAALATACGGHGAADRRAAPPSVRLSVTAPADAALTRGATVDVTGRVSPARARVLVAGRPVPVAAGSFRATVALREGANLIDVGASAPRATAAWVALRVTRQTLVKVPDLGGALRDDAVTALQARGLQAKVSDQDGIFEKLLPGDQRVCDTRPGAGSEVRAGQVVEVLVSKSC